MPPKFETVVVTKQPSKSKITTNVEVAGVCHAAQDEAAAAAAENNDRGGVVLKSKDFDKYTTEVDDDEDDDEDEDDNVDDRTAVRTLAANTGSVAILGTTAKCKSPDAPGQQQKPSSAGAVGQPSKKVVAAAAAAGSQSLLSPPPPPADVAVDPNGCREVVVYCVEATPIRRLAAETGSIAILASTVVCPPRQKTVEDVGSAELDRMPVGVAEALDAAERDRPAEAKPEPTTAAEDSDPLIPVPVADAMTEEQRPAGVPDDDGPALDPEPVPSPAADSETPRSATTDDDGDLCHADSHASSRSPLVRQSNQAADQNEYDGFSSSDKWFPKVPVFAKCLPPKSKSKSKYPSRLS